MDMAVLDTSALMLPIEHNLRLFDELERVLGAVDPVVPDAVVAELDRLSDSGGQPGKAASVGLQLVDRHCEIVPSETSNADDAVLAVATQLHVVVVTADIELIERAHDAGLSVVRPRGHHHLILEPP